MVGGGRGMVCVWGVGWGEDGEEGSVVEDKFKFVSSYYKCVIQFFRHPK